MIVLDLMLSGMDGIEVCRRLRANPATQGIPIIMLTAKAEEPDRILGLEMGVDDYVTKPFSVCDFVARVKTLLRRLTTPAPARQGPIGTGNLWLDPVRHEVAKGGKPVALSAMEFNLLEFFLRHSGRVYTRTQLLQGVWGQDRFVESRTVDVQIHRLREQIEDEPQNPTFIRTVRGVGYKASDENVPFQWRTDW